MTGLIALSPQRPRSGHAGGDREANHFRLGSVASWHRSGPGWSPVVFTHTQDLSARCASVADPDRPWRSRAL